MTEKSTMFENELRELAQLEAEAKQSIAVIDEQIAQLNEQKEALLQPAKARRESLIQEAQSIFEAAQGDIETETTIRQNVHPLITYRKQTDFVFDEEAAREYVIENKLWQFIRKPTLAKSAIKAAYTDGTAQWLQDAQEVSTVSVSIGKLGELLITG